MRFYELNDRFSRLCCVEYENLSLIHFTAMRVLTAARPSAPCPNPVPRRRRGLAAAVATAAVTTDTAAVAAEAEAAVLIHWTQEEPIRDDPRRSLGGRKNGRTKTDVGRSVRLNRSNVRGSVGRGERDGPASGRVGGRAAGRPVGRASRCPDHRSGVGQARRS